MSRNARFVAAAKGLLAVQVVGCVGAAGVTGWAAFEVRDMVRERDALAARVAQLEAVIPPQSLPPPPAVIETEAPPPPPDEAQPPSSNEAQPPVEGDPVVNTNGGGSGKGPPPPPPPPNDPNTIACTLWPDRSPSRCPLPLTYYNGYCRDVQNRPAICPGGTPPPPPPGPTPPPPPPPPARDCTRVDGRAVVCVPPFTRTPVRGVCVDGRARPVRCPANTPIQDAPRKTDGEQQSPTRR